MSEDKMWLTPRANEPENDTGFVERNGDRGAHCFGSLADQVRATPSSTCSQATGDSPSPSRPLWPTPTVESGAQHKDTPTPGQTGGTTLEGEVRAQEAQRSAPSASPRSSPMPVPSWPIGGLMSPTSAPFKGLPASEFYASAVSSRLSSLVAFLASRTVLPGGDSPAPTTAISGMNASACFGSYAPDSPSLKTSADSSAPNHLPRMVGSGKDFFSTAYCQTWPKAGTLANGKLYQQPTWERPTAESASGSSALTSDGWPTASARGWKDTPGMALDTLNPDGSPRDKRDNLPAMVYAIERDDWPTPTASEGTKIPSQANYGQIGLSNHPEIVELPTRPKGTKGTKDRKGQPDSGPPPLASGPHDPWKPNIGGSPVVQSAGKLSPRWTEALMGLPLGHTQLPRKFVKPRTTP